MVVRMSLTRLQGQEHNLEHPAGSRVTALCGFCMLRWSPRFWVLRITGFWLVSCSLSFVWELWQGLVATHRIFSRFRGWEALFSGFAYSAVPVFELSTVSITLKSAT